VYLFTKTSPIRRFLRIKNNSTSIISWYDMFHNRMVWNFFFVLTNPLYSVHFQWAFENCIEFFSYLVYISTVFHWDSNWASQVAKKKKKMKFSHNYATAEIKRTSAELIISTEKALKSWIRINFSTKYQFTICLYNWTLF
jgi:hypothetical protein